MKISSHYEPLAIVIFSARGFGSFDGTKEHEKQFNRNRLPTLNLFLGEPMHKT